MNLIREVSNNFSSANTNFDSDTLSNGGLSTTDALRLFEETKEVDVKFGDYNFFANGAVGEDD